jgi:hypothetical protein
VSDDRRRSAVIRIHAIDSWSGPSESDNCAPSPPGSLSVGTLRFVGARTLERSDSRRIYHLSRYTWARVRVRAAGFIVPEGVALTAAVCPRKFRRSASAD